MIDQSASKSGLFEYKRWSPHADQPQHMCVTAKCDKCEREAGIAAAQGELPAVFALRKFRSRGWLISFRKKTVICRRCAEEARAKRRQHAPIKGRADLAELARGLMATIGAVKNDALTLATRCETIEDKLREFLTIAERNDR